MPSMKMMAAAPPNEREQVPEVVSQAAAQLNIVTGPDVVMLLRLLMQYMPQIIQAGTTISEWVKALVDLWHQINPTPPAPTTTP